MKIDVADDERATPVVLRNKRGRKRSTLTPTAGMQDLVDAEKEKLRALAHQSFLQRVNLKFLTISIRLVY